MEDALYKIGSMGHFAGLMMREGSIVDASIISAPPSTKNEIGKRDREMHQTRKGSQWCSGMKLHIGIDDTLGRIHRIGDTRRPMFTISCPSATFATEMSCACLVMPVILGLKRVMSIKIEKRRVVHCQARRLSQKLDHRKLKAEKFKASIRAKVEHLFRYIKQVFGYSKVRYRGLAKSSNGLPTG